MSELQSSLRCRVSGHIWKRFRNIYYNWNILDVYSIGNTFQKLCLSNSHHNIDISISMMSYYHDRNNRYDLRFPCTAMIVLNPVSVSKSSDYPRRRFQNILWTTMNERCRELPQIYCTTLHSNIFDKTHNCFRVTYFGIQRWNILRDGCRIYRLITDVFLHYTIVSSNTN